MQKNPKTMDLVAAMHQSNAMVDRALSNAREFVTEGYKCGLSANPGCSLAPVSPVGAECIRMLHIEKLVLGEKDIHTRLVSLFQTMHDIVDACFLMICGHKDDRTDIYLGMRAQSNVVMAFEAMQGNLEGNFPGTKVSSLSSDRIDGILRKLGSPAQPEQSAAMVSMIPSRRNMVDSAQDSLDLQGLDTFVDTMRGKEYTAVILAVPLDHSAALSRRHALESMASSISPLQSMTYQYGKNMTVSRQHSINRSIADGITRSVSDAYTASTTHNKGTSRGSSSHMDGHFNALGIGMGSQHGSFSGVAVTDGTTTTVGSGTNHLVTLADGMTEGVNLGMSEGWNTTYTNRAVSSLLKEIDKQIVRVEQCDSYGAWDTCSYFVSPQASTVRIAAANFQALVCGENSAGSINVWLPGEKNLTGVLNNIAALQVPVFTLNGHKCQAGTMISGSELPILMNLPRKSVLGLPVANMAAFGREAFSLRADDPAVNRPKDIGQSGELQLGNVFHMGEEDKNNNIALNYNMFASHVLFTGTTGVGKSTTVAMMINALVKAGVNFMLVEPVKGEYKHLLGKLSGVQVFTSDPHVCRMLRINPFEFMDGVQVLAHIDRLIDIFSVCWPLYAAQPAVLRECIEEAYIECGWDLSNSEYMRPGLPQYPTFSMMLEILPKVIARSHFVGESKGTYEGALLARLGMLTRGLYGQMLNGAGGVSDRELFDGRVIIDLSAAGSQETIALIMGLLIIRLREYRIVTGSANNAPLHHVMVLEEAHNIFPREQQQSIEGGENIAGKSVKMLVQCIAEMRSYGQGFFIADQSPSAIDIAGLRNTATKIVMQLPEEADQSAIAKSLSLTDEQSRELSRLPRRAAVVYQNSWLEPVLIRIRDSSETSLGDAYLARVDVADQNEIRRARGAMVSLIIPMAESGVMQPEKLLNENGELAVHVRLNESKKRDLAAVCRHYIDWYREEGPFSAEEDDEDRITFFNRFLTDLMDCDLFLRMSEVPERYTGAASQNRDVLTRTKNLRWQKKARLLVDSYATGLNEQEKNSLLRLFLSGSTDPDCIALLDALYPGVRS